MIVRPLSLCIGSARLTRSRTAEEDVIHTRTQYLFDEEKDMTPLSQMQATKELLSGAQRIAYVGLCRLVTREMVQALKIGRHKELEAAAESMQNWATKIMGRLYHHMEVDTAGAPRPSSLGFEKPMTVAQSSA